VAPWFFLQRCSGDAGFSKGLGAYWTIDQVSARFKGGFPGGVTGEAPGKLGLRVEPLKLSSSAHPLANFFSRFAQFFLNLIPLVAKSRLPGQPRSELAVATLQVKALSEFIPSGMRAI